MPRYFFNLRRGPGPDKLSIDTEGEMSAVGSLRERALDMIRRTMTTRSDAVREWLVCSFEITDAQGVAVLTVPFTDIVIDNMPE